MSTRPSFLSSLRSSLYWPKRTWVSDLLSAIILFLLTCVFFWRTLSGDVYQPADGGDLVSFLFPTYRFAAEQLRQWSLPLWNPHLYAGAPFISDIQAGFLYPPNLLLFLLNPHFDYKWLQWFAIGHLYWAGLGMYILARNVPLATRHSPLATRHSPLASLFAAIAFQYSDALLIHQGNLNLIAVLSWLPWVLAAYQRALTKHSLRWLGLAALLFTIGNYAGHAQSSLYIGLALGLYSLFEAVKQSLSQGIQWQRQIRSTLAYLLILVGLTFLLSAPILFPAYELTQYSERSNFSYQESVAYSLSPAQAVIGLLTPSFFGRGPQLHWGLWPRVETPYLGVTALLLALAGILLTPAGHRRGLLTWIGLAGVGFLIALGIYGILHGVLTWVLPGFSQFRAPARAIILWVLAMAILAAQGVERLRDARYEIRNTRYEIRDTKYEIRNTGDRIWFSLLKWGAMLLVGFALPVIYAALLYTQGDPTTLLRASLAALALLFAAGFWLATWLLVVLYRRGLLAWNGLIVLLIVLLFFDLAATGAYTDISSDDPTRGYQHSEIANFLHSDPDLFRIDTRTGIEGEWQPDAAALLGLQDVGGIANPLGLRTWKEYWEATGGRQTRLYDLLNVKYVIVKDGTPLPEGKFTLVFDAPGALSLYLNNGFWPRAWLVTQAHFSPPLQPLQASLTQMQQAFDPTQSVLLDGSMLEGASDGGKQGQPTSDPGTVNMAHYGSSTLTLHLQAKQAGWLVLSELWYPGWQATVNGTNQEVLRANGVFRAIAVPAGESTVQLWFAPPSWRWGLIAFGGGLFGLLFCWFWRGV